MESFKLTDEELVELAKLDQENVEDDRLDVKYYQECHIIVDGKDCIFTHHLYDHYKKWSSDPISLSIFVDMLQLNKKDTTSLYINKTSCNINLDRILGEYVKEERKRQKEERLRQVSGFKPKT
jgi:hypothetical protein